MEIDPVIVVREIDKIIAATGEEWDKNQELIENKARAVADYDKAIALSTTALKAAGNPVSIIKEKAKGECRDELYDKILAEEMVKSHYSRIDILRSQLSAKKAVLNKYEQT